MLTRAANHLPVTAALLLLLPLSPFSTLSVSAFSTSFGKPIDFQKIANKKILTTTTTTHLAMSTSSATQTDKYSMADQQARFKKAKDENNQRYLDILTVYDP